MRAYLRTIVAVVVTVVVLVVVFLVLVQPKRSELSQVEVQLGDEQSQTITLQSELQRLRALAQQAPKLRTQLQKVRRAVPHRDDVADFIFDVQSAADAAGVDFVSVQPELPSVAPEDSSLAEVKVTIGAGGDYFSLQDFVRRLYGLDRALRIDALTFTKSSSAGGTSGSSSSGHEIDAQMTARIFYEAPPGSTATAGAAATPTTTPAPTPSPSPTSGP